MGKGMSSKIHNKGVWQDSSIYNALSSHSWLLHLVQEIYWAVYKNNSARCTSRISSWGVLTLWYPGSFLVILLLTCSWCISANCWTETQTRHSWPLLQDLEQVFYLHAPTYVLSPGPACSWTNHLIKNLLNLVPDLFYLNIALTDTPIHRWSISDFYILFYFWGKIRHQY